MPTHSFDPLRGRLETLHVDSEALASNLLGDPSRRSVAVYLPEGYDASDRHYPLFVDLVGFTGSGLKHVGWQGFGESVPQRIERLVVAEKMGPVVAVFPDGFTSLGGNQYIDSVALGQWETFLTSEMISRIEDRYRVRRGPEHRAVFGKSSGGYGALVHGMKHGDVWGAVACHSGDIDFDVAYRRDFPGLLDELARHGGEPAAFIEYLQSAAKIRGKEMHALMGLAMAATYDPDPEAPYGIRLPIDPHTAQLDATRWKAWLAHDPLRMVEREECQQSLRGLAGLFIDCGSKDQYALHYGARGLVRRLEALGIEHCYEEFDDDHSGIDYRMDVSLPFLYAAVGG